MPHFILLRLIGRSLPVLAVFVSALAALSACSGPHRQAAPAEPPYFASLKRDKAWGRRGPSFAQPVLWEYHRTGLPLLVVDETALWRQVRDPDGAIVWMLAALLSRRPMVMITARKPTSLYRTAAGDQSVIAYADPGAILRLGQCLKNRCAVRAGKIRGWAPKAVLWGVDAKLTAKQARTD